MNKEEKIKILDELSNKFINFCKDIEEQGFKIEVYQEWINGVPGPLGFRIIEER